MRKGKILNILKKHQSECVAEVKCDFCEITVMRKELEKHHSECVGFLQNQIKIKDEMIKKQAQKRILKTKNFIKFEFLQI